MRFGSGRTTTRRRPLALLSLSVALASSPSVALAAPPNGPELLRILGPRAQATLEPRSSTIGALVRVPPGATPEGLRPFAPGFARLRGTAEQLLAFSGAHPDLPLEVATPPHLLLDKVGQWTHATAARQAAGIDGTGVFIGVIDTGIDFRLDDFRDPATGHTRIAWLLDLTPFTGQRTSPVHYPDLEAKYGGAVFSGADLDAIAAADAGIDTSAVHTDTVGHGTHVASIAAGNGGLAKEYVGIAPGAQLIIARITQDDTESITTDGLLTGAQFIFDQADAMKRPVEANLSLGSDFGPHDGTMAWEESLATYVGPTQPGHAIVVAAGNSGDITSYAVHESVYVPPGGVRSVPISTAYGGTAPGGGQVQVWVTMRGAGQLSVGLDGRSGTWIAPVGAGQTGSYSGSTVDAAGAPGVTASVENGSGVSQGAIPSGSNSAIVVWNGQWLPGTYSVTLAAPPSQGGVADLYVEGTGDAIDINGAGVGFTYPVREGTVNIPATHPALIGVGATVNRPGWTSIAGGHPSVGVYPLDPRGGYALDASTTSLPVSGDVAWFSSAGPTVTGVQKPEISAPGGIVIAAMSQSAGPTVTTSIFYNPACPQVSDGGAPDPACMQVDATHAVAAGTSMAAPQAAGAIALLFQRDPTLTEDKLVGLLQAGAHLFRTGAPRFEDQGGPGELDVQGSLDALAQAQDPALALPAKATSWVTLSADELAADGSTPLTVIVELRTADGAHRADFFDATRLASLALLDDLPVSPPPALQRRAPGVWVYTVTPAPGLGGHTVTLGATFDGEPIVTPKTIPIATDVWTANYPSTTSGSCQVRAARDGGGDAVPALFALVAVAGMVRRRRYSAATDTTHPWGSQR
jgi:subtilisin family serine protease